ncbi:hypothetical protein H0E87_005314 [Populus deltoides]|uniref:3-hydroxyacyl-CoA dehydrogenase NAD binding domain-containing protein n=1 Tax=Populus deltoides TaxID=3696 RepID=A0A8T2ZIY5_POPDE|nr:hypothetical protein H0E87_005314 [Populus deltoides]
MGLVPQKVNKVVVVGGGLMGSEITTTLVLSKYPVTLKEVNKKFITAGIERIKANLQSRIKKGNMILKELSETLSLLNRVLDYESFDDVDMVIEAKNQTIDHRGETTSKGFYIYDNKGKVFPDPEVLNYIDKAKSMTGVSIDFEVLFFPPVSSSFQLVAFLKNELLSGHPTLMLLLLWGWGSQHTG